MIELLLVLAGCAAVLGLIAVYYHYTEPEVIDEEEEGAVEQETPEERAAGRAEYEEQTGGDSV